MIPLLQCPGWFLVASRQSTTRMQLGVAIGKQNPLTAPLIRATLGVENNETEI